MTGQRLGAGAPGRHFGHVWWGKGKNMAEGGDIDVDGLAALVLGGLEGEDLRRVEAHLATGCAQCARDRAWVERVVGLARGDRSVNPPPHVLARAKRIGASQSAQALPDGASRRRIRAFS